MTTTERVDQLEREVAELKDGLTKIQNMNAGVLRVAEMLEQAAQDDAREPLASRFLRFRQNNRAQKGIA